jgi:hypothetical protein
MAKPIGFYAAKYLLFLNKYDMAALPSIEDYLREADGYDSNFHAQEKEKEKILNSEAVTRRDLEHLVAFAARVGVYGESKDLQRKLWYEAFEEHRDMVFQYDASLVRGNFTDAVMQKIKSEELVTCIFEYLINDLEGLEDFLPEDFLPKGYL